MTASEATDLFQLRCIWQRYYAIVLVAGYWLAHRLGLSATKWITAESARELRGLIYEDHRAWWTGCQRQQ